MEFFAPESTDDHIWW